MNPESGPRGAFEVSRLPVAKRPPQPKAAIKRFAGEDYQKAVILTRDREYLLEVEPNVLHYEILKEERKR